MPYTDILNPTPTHPLNPDYGFQKKRPVTHLNAKANQGAPYFRDIMDVGHQFSLNWADKLKHDARKLKWYYESYKDGLFTLIDHENGGRHYVGRFSSPVEPVPTGNNRQTIQGVTFDEVPLSPMLQYPSDWQNDAVWRNCVNDFGDRMVSAVSGTWTLVPGSGLPGGFYFANNGLSTAASAAYVYQGYGFKFWGTTGPAAGKATIHLDGVAVGTVDFYTPAVMGLTCLLTVQHVPLGLHTLTLQPLNQKDTGATAFNVYFMTIQVMR